MEERKITEKVQESLLKGIANIGKVEIHCDMMPKQPLFYGEELEYISSVDVPELFSGEALTTLTVFEDGVVLISVMLMGFCTNEKAANEEADKYHMELKNGFVWGFSEDFYPGDSMRICTSFDYKDEASLCNEIEGRLACFKDKSYVDKLKPVAKYFERKSIVT